METKAQEELVKPFASQLMDTLRSTSSLCACFNMMLTHAEYISSIEHIKQAPLTPKTDDLSSIVSSAES